MPLLQFDPFSSAVEAPFWHALTSKKIDELKLDDSFISINAYYHSGFRIHNKNTTDINTKAQPARLCLGPNSFGNIEENARPSFTYVAPGLLKNTNTIEDFKSLDKNKLFSEVGELILRDIKSGEAISNPHLLNRFLLITFADLKKYKFYYWFGFPALSPPADSQYNVREVNSVDEVYTNDEIDSIVTALEDFRGTNTLNFAKDAGFFLFKKCVDPKTSVKVAKLSEWDTFWSPGEEISVGFADPSLTPHHPGWPLRNFLYLLKAQWNVKSVTVLCLREHPGKRDIGTSIVLQVDLPESGDILSDVPKFVGWERNVQGALKPRMADLAPLMDPKRLADTAVDLNLKLMRWRLVPSLDLEKISSQKCLLFGAGTLGCYVARLLLAWGVRNITFIDNGKVSFSNPVRQPLFEFTDCLEGGKVKAVAAADSLKKIFPGVNAEGLDLTIPMPGHSVSPQQQKDVQLTVSKITELIQSHDVLFLLTDSRESRWLPTVLGANFGKIVLTTALGFDTFLVMRHGMRTPEPTKNEKLASPVELGCYFCNDVVAPSDSLKDRTLDQQCTVTRPGISALASSCVVEMLVNILNNPRGPWTEGSTKSDPSEPTPTEMGLVPHQIRGFQTHFSQLLVVGQAYDKCTACSKLILDAYRKDGFDFLLKAFNSSTYLEDITGLSEMHKQTDEADIDWDEEIDD